MKIMITGSSGMVGKNISELAILLGYNVIAPNRKELNLLDSHSVNTYIKNNKPDLIIHCAGLVGGIQANIAAPYDFCYQNSMLGMNVINSAYQNGVQHLINLGSSCMYPREANNPLSEELILTGELEPTNEGYAISKILTTRLCMYLSKTKGVSYKTYIPCNLYGKWDTFDEKSSHMIPSVIRKIDTALNNNTPSIDVWGDGSVRREFMYAGDLADFVLYSLNNFGAIPDLINVGLGYDYSITEYYKTIANIIGYQGDFSYDHTKPSGMKQKLVDISKQTQLGWSPKTTLESGIQKTYNFYINEVK